MGRLKNISIRYKIMVPGVLLGVFLLGIATISMMIMNDLKKMGDAIADDCAVNIEYAAGISTEYQSLQKLAFSSLATADSSHISTIQGMVKDAESKINDYREKLRATEKSESAAAAFSDFDGRIDEVFSYIEQAIANNSTNPKEIAETGNKFAEYDQIISADLVVIDEAYNGKLEENKSTQTLMYNGARSLIIVFLCLAIIDIVVFLYVGWKWVCKRLININKQLRGVIDSIEAEHGDLSLRVQYLCTDEIGMLANSINAFIETLQNVMIQITTSSNSLGEIVGSVSEKVDVANTNSADISAVTEELSASMQEIASTLTTIKSNVEEVDNNIVELASESKSLHEYSVDMKKRATELKDNAVSNRQQTNDVINEIIEKLQAAIEESKNVEKVNGLTDEILNISGQTNLLALNASIEAARAGEAGKGFAVVADEISQLANSSRDTANNIQNINSMVVNSVSELISSAKSIVDYVNENIMPDYEGFVSSGTQYTEDAVHINEIVDKFNTMSLDISQFMESITGSIEGISTAVDESAEGATTVAMNTADLVKNMDDIANAMMDNKDIASTLESEADKFVIN